MSRNLLKLLLIGMGLCAILAAVLMLWPRGATKEQRKGLDETVANGSATPNQQVPPKATSPARKETHAASSPTPNSRHDAKQQELQRELERLANTQQYRDMLGRQERGEQLTREDMELLLKAGDIQGRMIKEPPIQKNAAYPPDDAKTQAMWDWWRKMKASAPNFEYKRPITFYGKVVDEAGNPISDASVVASIAGPNGDKEVALKSNSQGLFAIRDLKGKFITVEMDKRGYGRGHQSYGTFEFAEFFPNASTNRTRRIRSSLFCRGSIANSQPPTCSDAEPLSRVATNANPLLQRQ